MTAPRVLVPVADGFEEIETTTVVDMLRRAGTEVCLAGLEKRILTGSRLIKVEPDCALEEVLTSNFDMIVLPGGQPGVNNLRADRRLIQLVQKMHANGKWIAAICAAPLVLREAGLIEGVRLTSFPGIRAELPGCDYREERVVVEEKLVTSRGPGTALEFALKLIEILHGMETARSLSQTVLSPVSLPE